MKVGILTFHNAYNYGAVLQAYALKKYIGTDAEIIDYANEKITGNNHIAIREKNCIKAIIKKVYEKKIISRINKFKSFTYTYLVEKQENICRSNIMKYIGRYDVILTGSDQVWNYTCTGNDEIYYLNFEENIIKGSYAASFGKSVLLDEEKEAVKKYVSKYKYISVRESSAKEILENMGLENVVKVLDPTFLLSKEDWIDSFELKSINEKYIFVYSVSGDMDVFEYAKKISKKLGIKIICVTATLKPIFGGKKIIDVGPIDWLTYILNAELVITNSFHGCVFSIIFNKQFLIYIGDNNRMNSTRMVELLNQLDLSNNIVDKYSEDIVTIDFENVQKCLQREINISKKYLNDIKNNR